MSEKVIDVNVGVDHVECPETWKDHDGLATWPDGSESRDVGRIYFEGPNPAEAVKSLNKHCGHRHRVPWPERPFDLREGDAAVTCEVCGGSGRGECDGCGRQRDRGCERCSGGGYLIRLAPKRAEALHADLEKLDICDGTLSPAQADRFVQFVAEGFKNFKADPVDEPGGAALVSLAERNSTIATALAAYRGEVLDWDEVLTRVIRDLASQDRGVEG